MRYRSPFFYSAIAKINRKHRSVIGHGDGNGTIKLAVDLALYAKTGQEYPTWGEFLNPMVVEVGRKNIRTKRPSALSC